MGNQGKEKKHKQLKMNIMDLGNIRKKKIMFYKQLYANNLKFSLE